MADDFAEFFTKLTDNARTSLQHAGAIARANGSEHIGTEHLLLGVLAQGTSVGAKVLADADVTLERAELALRLTSHPVILQPGVIGISETARLTLKMSWQIAKDAHQEFLGTEHILYSLLNQKSSRASTLLRDLNVDVDSIRAELEEYFDRQHEAFHDVASAEQERKGGRQRGGGLLSRYGNDLTERARSGKLDPVIGRDAQIERMITILTRRTKNNPVLIGEPGVGKTAIVEALAQRIVHDEVPEHLSDARLIQLDMAALVAGTKYRGEFEERLQGVIEELRNSKNVIVFMDELHLLVGAGAADGAMDAANILKPALARGELHMIGATTFDEYRKHIEKDSALERRFQSIVVPEPSLKDTIEIVKGLRSYYEKHHNVILSDEVIELATHMSDRYVAERNMPDKAIDVIDEAAALTRVKQTKRPSELRALKKEESSLIDKIDDAVSSEEYERAALYKTRLSRVNEKIESLEESAPKDATEITEDHIARAVATMTGIPVEKVMTSEAKLLKRLEKHLSQHVIGQKEAIEKVARAVRRSRSGVASTSRPIGSFIFMGPTGVGKTELARVLAREVFGSSDALIKIDMSEFAEKHNTSRLVGAPAGYVGYGDGGQLTEAVRRKPYSVVLFDEIEKAHPDVFNMLLQLLEDGKLTDGNGREISFSNTIIVLTSNLGADRMNRESELGFYATTSKQREKLDDVHAKNAEATREELEKMMRPELINRFDAIVTFQALTRREISKIFDNLLNELNERLVIKGLRLTVKPEVKRMIIDRGFNKKYGARPLRRAMQDMLEHPVAEGVLAGKFTKGMLLTAEKKGKSVVVSEVHEDK